MGIVKYIFSVLFVVSAFCCAAQPDPDPIPMPDPPQPPGIQIEEPTIFPEIMPAYPGGEKQLMKDIFDNLVFPQVCVDNDFGGKVYVRFVVEKNGKISNVTVLKQPQGDLGKVLAKEAIRVVRNLKDFTPGTMNGEPKRVYYTLPINFHLQ
jgi:protein TonB